MRALLCCALVLAGCRTNGGDPADPVPGSEGAVSNALPYPTANIGTTVGKVIQPFCFPGFVAPQISQAQATICFADFYNPTGGGSFVPSMNQPFPAGPLPKALVVSVSGKWCSPCKEEAERVLPGKWNDLHGKGLMLVTVLADSDMPGQAASIADLTAWVSAFKSQYPSVIDPTYQMGGLFDSSQFPANFIIDPRTMLIVQFVPGQPDPTFWKQVEDML